MAQAGEQVARGGLLPLTLQNAYRERYRAIRPGWRSSGDQLEAIVRSHVTPSSRVLDLGCGRGGVVELFWREVELAAGLDPDSPSLTDHRAPGMPVIRGVGESLPFVAREVALEMAPEEGGDADAVGADEGRLAALAHGLPAQHRAIGRRHRPGPHRVHRIQAKANCWTRRHGVTEENEKNRGLLPFSPWLRGSVSSSCPSPAAIRSRLYAHKRRRPAWMCTTCGWCPIRLISR